MSLYQQQKADHPPIEALIEKHLSGARRRQALQFLAFMGATLALVQPVRIFTLK